MQLLLVQTPTKIGLRWSMLWLFCFIYCLATFWWTYHLSWYLILWCMLLGTGSWGNQGQKSILDIRYGGTTWRRERKNVEAGCFSGVVLYWGPVVALLRFGLVGLQTIRPNPFVCNLDSVFLLGKSSSGLHQLLALLPLFHLPPSTRKPNVCAPWIIETGWFSSLGDFQNSFD